MRGDALEGDRRAPSTSCSAPWALLARHLDRAWPFLLDRAGAASYAGSAPRSQIVVEATGEVREWEHGAWRRVDEHPVDALARYVVRNAAGVRRIERRRVDGGANDVFAAVARALAPETRAAECDIDTASLPRTVGFLAYEIGAFIERVGEPGVDPAGLPLAVLSTYDRIDAWCPRTHQAWTIEYEGAQATASAVRAREVVEPLDQRAWHAAPAHADAAAAYRHGFARILDAIRAGDIYQANLSRRIEVAFAGGRAGAARAYERLRSTQPVPCGAYLDLGSRQILSNSPECFVRVCDDVIETFPIKGTRPRHRDPRADARAVAELARDEKERAEHLMIVDLERSDLGRVARTGTVEVCELAAVRSFATVHHLVSGIRARLRDDATLTDVLRATFPGGSITGAPKIRAMEIIAEVEPRARGVYTGAVGCFNGARSFELNVAIRTAVAGPGRMQYCTGGGIVADSVLEREWEETAVKASAFLAAVGAAPSPVRAAV